MTLWTRFDEWSRAGVWQTLHERLLAKFNEADFLDLNVVAIDSSNVRAVGGEEGEPGRTQKKR